MKKPIRVAMIIQGYYPCLGGAERQLAALAPLLKARQVEVHVLTRQYDGLKRFEVIDEVPVHRLPIPGPKAIAALSFMISALPLLRRLRPNLIHAHELLSPTTTALIAKCLFGTPVVAKILRGGELGDLAKLHGKSFGTHRIAWLKKDVDAFITISQEIDQELASVGIEAARRPFIPNGVDIDRFSPLIPAERQSIRKALHLPDNALLTVFSGRLAKEKRIDQLISLWPTIRMHYSEAYLVILGSGGEAQALKAIAGEGVIFVGQADDVAPYLRTADLFVLPSATEGLSNAMLEALAAGLPTIATTVGGAPDVIDHNISGWLIPPDDATRLQQALLTLLGNSSLRERLGQQGREKVKQEYSLTATADQLRILYDQMIFGSSDEALPVITERDPLTTWTN